MANVPSSAVIRSVQQSDQLHLVVHLPASGVGADSFAVASDPAQVAIEDLFGNRVAVHAVHRLGDDSNLFRIEALAPPLPPGADAPAYRLTLGGVSTWFAPDSQAQVATPDDAIQPPPGSPAIDYLGRDYAAFTTQMRAGVAQRVGEDAAWALDHPADPMTTLIEMLAYAADHLSFRQDAAGTESYLPTARHRLSLRRHGRLRDYAVDDGCNARTALVVTVTADGVIPAGVQVVTQQPGTLGLTLPPGQTLVAQTTVFETMVETPVALLRNNLALPLARTTAYTLPKGTIQAQLNTTQTGLVPGQLLAFVQTVAPAGVAHPFGAQIVRLLRIDPVTDANGSAWATLISWHPEDALTAPLTLPAQNQPGMVQLYGNVLLADHGRSIAAQPVPHTAPSGRPYRPAVEVEDPVSAAPPPTIQPGFDGTQPLAQAALMVPSATATLAPDPRTATLCVTMAGERPGMAGVTDRWQARADLLATPAAGRAFAAAPEDGVGGTRRRLFLRFGDGAYGTAPPPGTRFAATVRVGDGQSGRVRANALVQIVGAPPLISFITNPLPAAPARPESNESVRLFAATGFRTNMRGIEPADWHRIARADPLVVSAQARVGEDGYAPCIVGLTTRETVPADQSFAVAAARLMDHAVLGAPPVIEQGSDVPVTIALVVYCVTGSDLAAVRARLLRRIGAGSRADGGAAQFNAAAWPLGRSVLLADLVATLRADPAVGFVVSDPASDPRIEFRTVAGDDSTAANIAAGRIAIRPHQRARADNNPLHPEFGLVRLYVAAMA